MLVLMDLSKQVGTIAGSRIAGDHIGHTAGDPALNGRAGDLQFWEEKAKPSSVSIPRLADCLLDPVVVSPPRVRSWHLGCTGRRVRESGLVRKCLVFSRRCSCNAWTAECSGTELAGIPGMLAVDRPCSTVGRWRGPTQELRVRSLLVSDANGEVWFAAITRLDGTARLELSDGEGKSWFEVAALADGTAALALGDPEEKRRFGVMA
jgi:hypothetical protein